MKAARQIARGLSGLPEHDVWVSMWARCTKPTDKSFKNYGARGISVCARWADFALFLSDAGRRPSPAHSLDRIKNDLGYEPGNVRWATRREQSLNTRRNRRLTLNGETLTLCEWADRTGLPSDTIRGRLRRGWPEDLALAAPRMAQTRHSRSGFRGVRRVPGSGSRRGWAAEIRVHGNRTYLGTFAAPEDAARAFDAAAVEARGDLARLNFPRENTRVA
jgi:hypothetical protein